MKSNNSLIESAKRVFKIESDAVAALADRVGSDFSEAVHALDRKEGRLFVTGMGKSGLIGKKIAATMSSVGLPAVFVHAAEGIHGDLGLVSRNDRVIAISNSGETEEILKLLPTLSRLKCTLITMTGNLQSTLATRSDYVLDIGVKEEAGGNGLIPTASTTATLAMGDALVIAYLHLRGFREEDFALNHPGGSLGRKMLTIVEDLMHVGNTIPMVYENADIATILSEMTQKRLGTTLVTDKNKMKLVFFQPLLIVDNKLIYCLRQNFRPMPMTKCTDKSKNQVIGCYAVMTSYRLYLMVLKPIGIKHVQIPPIWDR